MTEVGKKMHFGVGFFIVILIMTFKRPQAAQISLFLFNRYVKKKRTHLKL